MAFYECVVIAKQELSPTAAEALVKDYQKIVTDAGGKVVKTESWGLKTFAYRVDKQRKGYYTLMELDTAPAPLLEMERLMRLDENVIRHLTLRIDEFSKEPSKQKEAA